MEIFSHTFNVLGYFNLLDIISQYSTTPLGKGACKNMRPMVDLYQINMELDLVQEARLFEKVVHPLSFSEVEPITSLLKKTFTGGTVLEPEDFLTVLRLLDGVDYARKLFSSYRDLCPLIWDIAKKAPDLTHLSTDIRRVISSNGTILDNASPALRKIRRAKAKLRTEIQSRLQEIQKSIGKRPTDSETLVTIRDGRYILSVKTSMKNRVKGIVHDYSHTRATCFIEPMPLVEFNNRMAELTVEEREEEYRLLRELTDKVKNDFSSLETLEDFVGRIDALFAKARFAERLSCTRPEIEEKGELHLKNAKNPILLSLTLEQAARTGNKKKIKTTVPVDIHISKEKRLLIISGPNGGGKTVTLKTMGLLTLMAHTGLHVPVDEGSCIPMFTRVMADIGDDQDLETGLSTYTARITLLKYITGHADEKSLILLDEPGMGTDPAEGVALTMAALDFLSDKGAFVAISTHLNRLKAYGYSHEHACNASVEFDTDNNSPSFRLNYGISGISHALDLASNIGLREDIIERARKYVDRDEVRLSTMIEELNSSLMGVSREREELEKAKERYINTTEKLKKIVSEIENKEKILIEEKRAEAEQAIYEAKREFNRIIGMLKEKKDTQAKVSAHIRDTSKHLSSRFKREIRDKDQGLNIENIKKGQLVYLKKLKQKGTVLSINHMEGQATIAVGNMRVTTDVNDMDLREMPEKKHTKTTDKKLSIDTCHSSNLELNVIGYRVEEALKLIDKYIDMAMIQGKTSMKIVHGYGTGRLRKGVRDYLKKLPFVKNIKGADLKSGGEAITLVELW